MRIRDVASCALVCCALAGPANSFGATHDMHPPGPSNTNGATWTRGGPTTTYQAWEFGNNNSTPGPDTSNNPFGTPSLTVNVGPFGSSWYSSQPSTGTQTGFWDIG